MITCVKQIFSTDTQQKNGDRILVTCSENFQLDLARFPDTQPNPSLRLPFSSVMESYPGLWRIGRIQYCAQAPQVSVFLSLKWDSWTWLWFLTTGGHENHKMPSISLVPSLEHSVSGMEQRLDRWHSYRPLIGNHWTWSFFFLTFSKNNFIFQ